MSTFVTMAPGPSSTTCFTDVPTDTVHLGQLPADPTIHTFVGTVMQMVTALSSKDPTIMHLHR